MLSGFFGDIVGSVYEGRQWVSKDLSLFQNLPLNDNLSPSILKKDKFIREHYFWTDDSLCTLALYYAYINKSSPIDSLVYFCNKYSDISTGFGKSFEKWLKNPVPYGSYGNGAIMRLGFIPFINENLNNKLAIGLEYTGISHNHVDSYTSVEEFIKLIEKLKVASSVAIKKTIIEDVLIKFQFIKTVEMMHNDKKFEINSLTTFLQACRIILESDSYDNVFKNVFYVGGDSDTLACVAGNIAEHIWDFPRNYKDFVLELFIETPELSNLINDFILSTDS